MAGEVDTVAAIATPAGTGAIGIVRLTGPRSRGVLRTLIPSLPVRFEDRRVYTAWAVHPESGERIDQVVAFSFDPASSHTGEQAAEIHGHGGPLVLDLLLAAALAAGARPARPGEFTRRAFLSGRIDLVQAEAVALIVSAACRRAASASALQLAGGLSREFLTAREPIVQALAHVEATLDFPDDEVPAPDRGRMLDLVDGARSGLARLLHTWESARRIFDGLRVVLAGPPNSGKSSLFNRILGRSRALVDDEPGTTRDYIEARTEIGGVPVTLVDTAGLRGGGGRVESLGIELSLESARSADVVLLVVDGSGILEEPLAALRSAAPSARIVAAVNKIDLPTRIGRRTVELLEPFERFEISALTGEGVDELARCLARGDGGSADLEGPLLSCSRHRDLVAAAVTDLDRASAALDGGLPAEILASELRAALRHVDELTGREVVPDVLDAIFSRFCIGK